MNTPKADNRVLDAYERVGKAVGELVRCVEALPKPHEDDEALLAEALAALERATFHDGRYRQEQSSRFQNIAQPLVLRLAKRLQREPYKDFHS